MAFTLYAGLASKNSNNQIVVEKYVPFNIVKPSKLEVIDNDGGARFHSTDATYTLDAEPINLTDVFKQLYNVDTLNFKNIIASNKRIINVFTSQSVDSITPLTFYIYTTINNDTTCRISFGYMENGIYFNWQFDGNKEYYILSNPQYECTSFESLLNDSKNYSQTALQNLNYNSEMNLTSASLFNIYFNDTPQRLATVFYQNGYKNDIIGQYNANLSTWQNWYTMLTGKYFYGMPFSFELQTPVTYGVKTISKIDCSVPMSFTFLDEGYTYTVNNHDVTYVKFFNNGTDISFLFYLKYGYNANTTTDIYFKENGYIERSIPNKYYSPTWRFLYGGKGMEAWSDKNQGWYDNKRVSDYMHGVFLFVPYNFATISAYKWLKNIPSDYSHIEYGNAPLFLATVGGGFSFTESTYGRTTKGCLFFNYNGTDPNRMMRYDDYPIDYSFWEGILNNLPGPSGPNIGGGSIGGGSSSTGGGTGSFDDASNNISQPSTPSGISGTSGLFSMYAIGTATLDKIGNWLVESWTDEKKSDTINSKMQSIISFKQICAPGLPNIGNTVQIKAFGDVITGAFGDVITSQYRTFNMGSYTFNEYFGSFLDYAPHTKISLYLPFVGIVSIDTNTVMGGKVTLTCGVDWISGNITYNLSLEKDSVKSVLNSWTGNSSCDIPISQLDYSSKIAAEKAANISLLTMAGTTVAAGVALGLAPFTGGMSVAGGMALAGAVGGAAVNAAKQVSNYNMTEGQAASSLGGGGSAGFMNVKVPYFIIDRPISSLPINYAHTNGYMSNINSLIGDQLGYTEIAECNLSNFSKATEKEVNEIMSLLKTGVIL